MATYLIKKSGSGVSISIDSADPIIYERQWITKRGFQGNQMGANTLELYITIPGLAPQVLSMPLANITIEETQPGSKAACMTLLATVFSEPSSGTPTLAEVLEAGNDGDGSKIVNIANPEDDQDVATKKYVDDNSGGATPALTQNQIAFGDENNLMRGSAEFVYDNANGLFSVDFGGTALLSLDNNNANFNVKFSNKKYLSIDKGLDVYAFGDIEEGAEGNLIVIDGANHLAYYDVIGIHDGKFGINKVDPAMALDVVGSLRIAGGDYTEGLMKADVISGVVQLGDAGELVNGTSFIVDDNRNLASLDNIAHNANFGINTVNPDFPLHVIGNSRLDGTAVIGTGNPNGGVFEVLDASVSFFRIDPANGYRVSLLDPTQSGKNGLGIDNSGNTSIGDAFGSGNGTVININDDTGIIFMSGKVQMDATDFADNAAAISGGLTNGQIYRTGDVLKIVH